MKANWEKIRKFKRIFFSSKNALTSHFIINEVEIKASVLDLSAGGIGCSVNKKDTAPLVKGELVYLSHLQISDTLTIRDVKMRIKWIIDYDKFDHLGFGCEFISLSDEERNHLQAFVENYSS